jgi:hypothetical protein
MIAAVGLGDASAAIVRDAAAGGWPCARTGIENATAKGAIVEQDSARQGADPHYGEPAKDDPHYGEGGDEHA